MAGLWTSERFPQFETTIRRLTEEHRELQDEPLHLAVSYSPTREQHDVFLFEVIGSTEDEMASDGDLFETTFHSTSGFPLGPNERLHLILTNPRELEMAVRQQWPRAVELVNAVLCGDYKVLHADEVGRRTLDLIAAENGRRETVCG